MIKGISFDVWGTIFGDSFFSEISKHYSTDNGITQQEVDKKMDEAYKLLRENRKQGAIPPGSDPVAYSLKLIESFGFDLEKFKSALAKALLTVEPEPLLLPGVKDVLSKLSGKYKLILLGNVVYWPGAYTRVLMERAGLSNFFSAQLYSDEIGTSKPYRDAFSLALKALELDNPSEAVHVGDNLYEDFCGAVSSDFHAVLVSGKANQTLRVEGNFIINRIEELPSVISAL